MDLLALLLAFGATARLAILLTRDQFPPTVTLRARVLKHVADREIARLRADAAHTSSRIDTNLAVDRAVESWPYVLVTCPWCCSFWLALPACTAAWWQPTAWWFLIPAAALTASLAAGVIAQLTAN